jgi:O-methyltransferase
MRLQRLDRAKQCLFPSSLTSDAVAAVLGFRLPLPRADAYLLSNVVHDWADEQATAILLNVRRAIPDAGKLLVFENVMPEGPEAYRARALDILMLALTGGRERTRSEYERLLDGADFQVTKVIQTASLMSIVEANAPMAMVVGSPNRVSMNSATTGHSGSSG